MRLIGFGILALGLAGFFPAAAAHAAGGDEAVREAITAQAGAWNAHDAHGYMQLFADDAGIVTPQGWQWKGRDEAERKLRDAFSLVYAESKLHIDDLSVRFLSPDVAVAQVTWSLSGAKTIDGSGPEASQKLVQTEILQRTDGRWLVSASQGTALSPERAFPTIAPPPRRCVLANRNGGCIIEKGGARDPK